MNELRSYGDWLDELRGIVERKMGVPFEDVGGDGTYNYFLEGRDPFDFYLEMICTNVEEVGVAY